MEREANALRCDKLSCYAEFNRMVHAIARSVQEPGLQRTNYKMTSGSSAEHLFYTSLTSMLSQIVHNSDPVSQRTELQQVYQWFCTNKPLISTKTMAEHQKPTLSLSRPHTVPTAFSPSPPSLELPLRPSSSDHTPQSQPLHGFTSSYVSQSLAQGLKEAVHHSPPQSSPRSSPSKALRPQPPARSAGRQSVALSVVEMTSGGEQTGLNPSTLMALAPVVAARMELQREMVVRHPLWSFNSTAETRDHAKRVVAIPPANGRNDVAVTHRPLSPPAPLPHTPHLSPPPRPPTITMKTHPSPDKPSHSHRSPPLHVVELDPPPSPPNATSSRARPAALKRSTPKVASGFNCSRYRLIANDEKNFHLTG